MKVNVIPINASAMPAKTPIKRSAPKHRSQNQRYMLILKCSMAVCVVLVAAGIGYTAYKVVRDSEQEQFMQNYSQLVKQLKPATNNGRVHIKICCADQNFDLTKHNLHLQVL